MRMIGIIFAALLLIAIAPSDVYGKGGNPSLFKVSHRWISFVDNVAGSDANPGTLRKPYKTIQYAIASSLEGAAIYVISSGLPYEVDASSSPIVLKKGQSLIGSSLAPCRRGADLCCDAKEPSRAAHRSK